MHLADNIQLMEGAVGGVCIGVSATLFMYLTGKITGLSGIVEGLVKIDGEDWQWTYVSGLMASGVVGHYLFPGSFSDLHLSVPVLAAAGVISGFGTRLSGGCTSGHGLCGLGRFSPRSLTSVILFMASGMITAKFSQMDSVRPFLTTTDLQVPDFMVYVLPTLGVLGLGYMRVLSLRNSDIPSSSGKFNSKVRSSFNMHVVSFISSFLFGTGLTLSGMTNPTRVVKFLDFSGSAGFDPTLGAVLFAGVGVTTTMFNYLQRNDVKTYLGGQSLGKIIKLGAVIENMKIDWHLAVGSIMFGIGWGLAGMCPGPGVVAFGGLNRGAQIYFPGLMLGVILKDVVFGRLF